MAASEAGNAFATSLRFGVSEDHLKKNPALNKLLQDLGKRISIAEALKATKIKAAEERYRKAKNDYFDRLLFYTALLEIFVKSATREVKTFLPEDQLIRNVHMRLACAETGSFLEACAKDCASQDFFLGLKAALALNKPTYSHEDVKKMLVTEIEKWLKEKERAVLQCYYNESTTTLNSSQLVTLLEKDVKTVRLDKQKLKSDQLANERLLSKYSEVLSHATSLLIKILGTINLELQINYNQEKVNTMVSKSQALKLKAKSILLEIQKETYTPEVISALKCVRSQLDKKENAKHKEILDINSSLSTYEKLGHSFEKIAEDVRKLNQDIEMQKWNISNFDKL